MTTRQQTATPVRRYSMAPPLGSVRNFHRYIGGDPLALKSWEALTGDAFLRELETVRPALAAHVKAIAEGLAPAPGPVESGADAVLTCRALAMYVTTRESFL